MFRNLSILVAACLVMLAVGCGISSTTSTPLPANDDETLSGKLVLTGSSTIAPLAAEIAKRFEAQHPQVRVDVQTGGSSRGIADVLSGTAQIGMASRRLKPEEIEKGVEAHRIAADGVCLIVNSSNPANDLSDEQVVQIFTGKITSWHDLGGADAKIVVVNKAEGRATLEVFLEHFKLNNADITADIIGGENQQVIQTVAGNEAAIGYVSIGEAAAEAESGTAIKLISAAGIAPTVENVAKDTFPITRPLNLVTSGELTSLAEAFIAFAQSEEVHDLVQQQGFVPVSR